MYNSQCTISTNSCFFIAILRALNAILRVMIMIRANDILVIFYTYIYFIINVEVLV